MRIFLLAALAWLGWTGAATAAPQVLALVSTDVPVALSCAGTNCAARFTTFCLQPDRVSPTAGHRYTLAAAEALELTGVRADGAEIRLDPAAVTIKAATSHVSVLLSLPRVELERQGLATVAVRVRGDATLVPVPEPGDERPQTEADLALATTVLRELGRQIVDHDGMRMAAARETMYVVNHLPGGRLDGGAAQTTLAGILTPARLAALPPAARPFVTHARDYCATVAGNDPFTTLRQCLEAEHDTIMHYLNQDYWDALQGGS